MWLDRFSGHNTPSASPLPRNRSYSPVPPRGSSHLAPNAPPRRPGFNQRVSSWSGLTNGSTESLPSSARLPNGSSLRNQLSVSTSDQVANPLDVLRGILAPSHSEVLDNGQPTTQVAEEELVEDVDFGGLSLHNYVSSTIDHDVALQPAQVASKEYEEEKDKFEDLHKSIAACDEVLHSVEKYLTSFQADLAAVSAEIETLQNRSAALNNKLQTRKDVEKLLGPEVDGLSLSPQVVRKIADGSLDEAWVRALGELEKRSKAIEVKSKSHSDLKALDNLKPLINSLNDRAVERIRDYVVSQVKALRAPGANAQIIQQNALLRYKDSFAFLSKHQPQLEEEIGQAYVNTMRWYYHSNFTRYKASLEKMHLHSVDKNDVLAQDDTSKKATAAGNRPGGPHDALSLGRRIDILKSSNPGAMPSHVAEEDKSAHYLEVPFRAYNLALVDNASAEYSFLTEFFSKKSLHVVNRKFNEIFEPTFALGQSFTKQMIDPTLDALGILICVRLNQHSAFELQRRKVPSMDGYINGTSMLLWPRFQMVMDLHCESLRKATASLSGRPAGSALSLTASSANVQSVAPHPVTQKFAIFTQGILKLSTEAGDDEPVQRSLGRLRIDFEAFLSKLSKGIADAKKRERLLSNNFSLIGTIINDTEGKMADELKEHFEELAGDAGDRR